MKSEAEVEAHDGKLESCPLCGSNESEGHKGCFHCLKCGYLQCCDYDGFFDKHRAAETKP